MSFGDICGQQQQIAFLRNAMARERVSHAYLFYGMGGVGKRSTALVFARALNCREVAHDACDRCPSCRKGLHGNHPDVITLEPAGQFIRIQEVRDLQNQMRFRPLEGGKRVFIIVDAERMNSPAANALLKTLEEPTPSNILILISSRPHQLPMTILSRCQRLRFHPLGRDLIAAYLVETLHLEGERASVLAASAGGSIGKALEMHRDSYLENRNEIIGRITLCRKEDLLGALSLAGALGKERESVLEGLNILRTWYRDVLVYRETGDTARLIYQDRLEEVKKNAEGVSGAELLKNIRTINRAYGAIERNANKQLTLETMLFKLAYP
jgi:DNA polymerase-3 subunit delta'